jgi:hypothetical protein
MVVVALYQFLEFDMLEIELHTQSTARVTRLYSNNTRRRRKANIVT